MSKRLKLQKTLSKGYAVHDYLTNLIAKNENVDTIPKKELWSDWRNVVNNNYETYQKLKLLKKPKKKRKKKVNM